MSYKIKEKNILRLKQYLEKYGVVYDNKSRNKNNIQKK